MSYRKRSDKYLVTVEFGLDEFGIRRCAHRTVSTQHEANRLDTILQYEIHEGRHIQPSSESSLRLVLGRTSKIQVGCLNTSPQTRVQSPSLDAFLDPPERRSGRFVT